METKLAKIQSEMAEIQRILPSDTTVKIKAPHIEPRYVSVNHCVIKVNRLEVCVAEQSRYEYDIIRHYLPRNINQVGNMCPIHLEAGTAMQHWMSVAWLTYFSDALPLIVDSFLVSANARAAGQAVIC